MNFSRFRAMILLLSLALATHSMQGAEKTAGITPPAAANPGEVVFAGSDFLKGACAAAWEKSVAAIPSVAPSRLSLDGSLMGEKHLRSSRAAAALLFIPDKAKVREIAEGHWIAVPLAFQTIVVVVGRENRLERLDVEMLASIFGAQEAELRRSWLDIPGSGLNVPIRPLMTRRDLSFATPWFRTRVLRNQEFRPGTLFFAEEAEEAAHLSSNPAAIGAFATAPVGMEGLRVVPLAASAKAPSAYLPTEENLRNGDYPLSLPLYLVVPRNKLAAVRPFLPAALGDDVADALRRAGFTPVEKKMRKKIQETLDTTR